jgi:hypothetical protein
MNETAFYRAAGIDPIVIAALLWAATGDVEAGEHICAHARELVQWITVRT